MEPPERVLHPALTPEEVRSLFQEGVALFHQGAFFAAHEAWETIWRSTPPEPRDLHQGLIQVAAGFHHYFDRNRPRSALTLFSKGRRRLEPFVGTADGAWGIALAGFLAAVQAWEEWLAGGVEETATPPGAPRLW